MRTVPLLRTVEDLDAGWLSDALGRPGLEIADVARIGTGQMSQSHRVTYRDGAGGENGSVVLKIASEDPTSRGTGVGMGAYRREVSFYRNLAARIGGPVVGCHATAYDEAEGWFTLLLEDVVGASQGDQIAGCGPDEARLALVELARLQAPVLNDLALGMADWLNLPNPLTQALLEQLLPGFLERYGDRVAPEHAEVCRRFAARCDAWAADVRPPVGLVHGDYRLDNLLFGGGTCRVVDWQTVTWGPATQDAAYFVGGALTVEDRREHEEDLVRAYHAELVRSGAGDLTWERCWDEYRRQTFQGILMAVVASMVTVRTDRGDEMFVTLLARHAQQILDLGALDLLPAEGEDVSAALEPDPADEGRHEPGPEAMWNESWYFDAVDDGGGFGVYARLGRLPNQGTCLYSVAICGPGRPSVMLVDAAAPLPADDDDAQRVVTDAIRAEQHCEEPLRRFRVVAEGTARSHDDPAAPLRGEAGTPVEVALDLTWETDGAPYAWRQTTRYEIPCRVTGTVRIGDEELTLSGPGQRDHSWSSRDWWASDWMWSAFHLEDGTHTHAVAVPQLPGRGVGYAQRDGVVQEIATLELATEPEAPALPTAARLASGPDGLDLAIEPLGFGALLLEAPDGRLSHFPRAMCRVRDADGRTGLGWMEWNRVQGG